MQRVRVESGRQKRSIDDIINDVVTAGTEPSHDQFVTLLRDNINPEEMVEIERHAADRGAMAIQNAVAMGEEQLRSHIATLLERPEIAEQFTRELLLQYRSLGTEDDLSEQDVRDMLKPENRAQFVDVVVRETRNAAHSKDHLARMQEGAQQFAIAALRAELSQTAPKKR